MLSEISVKVFRSGRKLVGPAETDIIFLANASLVNSFT
jgi:hypothetical protein